MGVDYVSQHAWWHNERLRYLHAAGPGWRLFEAVYRPAQHDGELLAAVRQKRLTEALHWAAVAPQYRGLLAGRQLSPDAVQRVHDELPVLEKTVLRETPGQLRTGLVDDWNVLRVHTSGTTGEPVCIENDESKLIEATASNYRMLEAYGLAPGLRVLRFTADLRHPPVTFTGMPYFGGADVLRVNVATLTAADSAYLRRLCVDFDAHVLWGQPLELLLAGLRVREGLLDVGRPAVALTHGDTVDATTRDAIAEVFGTRHFDLYGLQEFGRVAWECPDARATYHIDEERLDVSVAADGQVLISSLINRAMVLLRYRPGDAAELVASRCPCGRVQRRLARIEGRNRSLLIDANGRLVNVKPVRLALEGLPLQRWQVLQTEPGSVEVLFCAPLTPRLVEQIAGAVGDVMKLDRVAVRQVALAELATPSGKAPHFRLLATQRAVGQALTDGAPIT
jgi:phenylacetate-CoA ligase